MIKVQEFFDSATNTLTYLVWDPATRDAVVIDPLLDYEPSASVVSEESVGKVTGFLEKERLTPHYILETHAHADHLSGSQPLKLRYPKAILAIGKRITEVQKTFSKVFDLGAAFPTDGRQFDRLLSDGEKFRAGSLEIEVIFTPGHTPACASYLIGDAVFTGDALFMPDYGVGRCDFPDGSASTLYDSITERLYGLPDATRVFTCHDYLPNGRALRFESTIGEEKRANVHVNSETTKEKFVEMRTKRDKTLSTPRLLLPSVHINIDAGRLPPPRANGKRYLSIPLSVRA